MSQEPPKLAFLLGAGASVEAGVPDTFGLVDAFVDSVKANSEIRESVETIVDVLKATGPKGAGVSNRLRDDRTKRVDVEQLLEVLEKLRARDQEDLLRFYKGCTYILAGKPDIEVVIASLRDFIKATGIVSDLSVGYLQPLQQFLLEYATPLDIFSVNYDTAIEQFCSVYRLDFSDGFDQRWNPSTFENKADIRLYKLHGSITWYRTDRGDYVKIPIKSTSDKIELVTDERAQSLILYPMRKWQYAEPLLELLVILKRRLEEAKYCVVVGYSFRDEHIVRIFWDAARKNRGLQLILIGPRAAEIYQERLKFYRETAEELFVIPSSLSGRVLILPYKFEAIFPRLRDRLRHLSTGFTHEQNAQREKMFGGQNEHWRSSMKYAIEGFVDSEHIEKAVDLMQGVDWATLALNWQESLRLSFKLWFLSRSNAIAPTEWRKPWADELNRLSPRRIKPMFASDQISLNFEIDASSSIPYKALSITLRQALEWFNERTALLDESGPIFPGVRNRLADLLSYLSPWDFDFIPMVRYFELRKSRKTQTSMFERLLSKQGQSTTKEEASKLVSLIREIERPFLEPILSGLKSSTV